MSFAHLMYRTEYSILITRSTFILAHKKQYYSARTPFGEWAAETIQWVNKPVLTFMGVPLANGKRTREKSLA